VQSHDLPKVNANTQLQSTAVEIAILYVLTLIANAV
jgi:hypothetical protein